jgi:RHH-type transcriptional regulator, proline utilization regulon repressor / proline dehydrogenase / delta 1-pyrroline-5-carboxylate dehydrogenase
LICGNLYINRPITGAMVGRQPFGGFRMSGGGSKAGGREYLENFVLPRVITENLLRRGFVPAAQGGRARNGDGVMAGRRYGRQRMNDTEP